MQYRGKPGIFSHMNYGIEKIVSGGQTGVDRAALDVAITLNIPHGGWCPKGRIAENGGIPAQYLLRETPTTNYSQRTEWNVRDSDGTLIVSNGEINGGTLRTVLLAQVLQKPFWILDLAKEFGFAETTNLSDVRAWLKQNDIKVLNVAGARASKQPEIYTATVKILKNLLQ